MNHINIEEKIKHLNRCSTFKDLGVKVIRKIAENSEEIEESSGKHLYFQGEDADHFYLVISGKVEIKGAEIIANAGQVFTCGASSLVGYSSHLLAQESPRQNKSARVVEDSKLLKINERAIKIIKEGKPLVYREHCATTLRELLSSAPQTEVIKQLRLEPKVFSNAEISVLVAGERVFEEGDISDFAYFIIGGSIKIVRKNSGIQEDMVARLRPGQMFGERGFEEENSRAAGAESEGVSTILCINHKALRNISKTNETMHRLLANQSDLYTMKDSSGIIPKAIKNLNIASKVTILALAAMVAITGSWYFIGTRVLNDNFSHRLVAENKHNLEVIVQKIKNSYDEYIEQERFFLDFANSSKKNGDMISIGSHRELDIYLFNGISRPTMSVNKIIEDAILLDIENIFDGNTVSQGFQHIVDENISAYYKVTPSIIDGKVVAVVASVFDPIKISGRENLMISIPGKSTILGKFRGRERDLDRQPNDFLQVGPLIYSVAKEKIELPDISFGSYTWVDLSTALAQEKSLKIKILVSIIMSITVSVSLIYFLTAWAMHPFKDLSHSIRRLTEGQRSIIIPYADRTNEFGRLAKDFATLQDAIARSEGAVAQRLVDQQKKLQRQEEAKVNIQRFQNIFDEYVGDFHDSVETFTKISGLLLESSTSASNSTDEIQSAFQDTEKSIHQVENMSILLKDETSKIQKKTFSSKETLKVAISDATLASKSNERLEKSVEDIEGILVVIKGIAEKTRLLALNATIEASKAGPSGKGFFVVAQEVRNLANQTSDALHNIHSMVSDIEVSSSDVGDALGKITTSIDKLKSEQTSIIKSVQKQSDATHKIALDVEKASGQTRKVSDSMVNISSLVGSSEEVSENMNDSARILKDTSTIFENKIYEFLKKIT